MTHRCDAGAAVELRFEGSEELGYDPLGTPPKGEICLRGPIIFQGYYQDKKKTDEAFGGRLSTSGCAVLLNASKATYGQVDAYQRLNSSFLESMRCAASPSMRTPCHLLTGVGRLSARNLSLFAKVAIL